jgi:hypothetical protein
MNRFVTGNVKAAICHKSMSKGKLITISLLFIVLLFNLYSCIWGKTFDVDDVRQSENFSYQVSGYDISGAEIKIKGEINGRAVITAGDCERNSDLLSKNTYLPFKLRIKGRVDTTISGDFYSNKICLLYSPKTVQGGNLTITVKLSY